MELQHRFTVPTGIDDAWAHFTDIQGVAECFPGATVTEADEESFTGTVKVKLGPIALVYNGTGTFVEKDEAGRRLVIDAKGKDKRGNGTAQALVTATLTESGADATDVEVGTDLSITGKAAQFGRGNVIKDVSDKLLGQFVACLEQRFADSGGSGDSDDVGTTEATGSSGAAAAAAGTPAPTQDAPPGAAPAPEPPPGDATTEAPAAADVPPPAAPRPPPQPQRTARAQKDEAIDLGATVLPVLARAYWKPAAGAVAVLLLIWWLLSRD